MEFKPNTQPCTATRTGDDADSTTVNASGLFDDSFESEMTREVPDTTRWNPVGGEGTSYEEKSGSATPAGPQITEITAAFDTMVNLSKVIVAMPVAGEKLAKSMIAPRGPSFSVKHRTDAQTKEMRRIMGELHIAIVSTGVDIVDMTNAIESTGNFVAFVNNRLTSNNTQLTDDELVAMSLDVTKVVRRLDFNAKKGI